MNYKKIAAVAAVIATLAGLNVYTAHSEDKSKNEVLVTNTEELIAALENAQAGDEIILREGIYQNDKWLGEWAAFYSHGEGTSEQPIVIRSEDPENPATISAASQNAKYALYILGDHWIIKDLCISNAAKGIMLDNSNYSVVTGCEVYDIGDEAIHIRDNSSYCLIENCYIHDAGTVNPQYGEGVYIGSAYNAEGVGFDCHYNTVRNCKFGPNIAADHVDIKEYTIGNIVEYCTFDGTGIQNLNGGNSFAEVKGNHNIIRYNTGYRNGNENVLYGFDMSNQVEGWGQENLFHDNTLYLDTTDCYAVKGWNCSAQVFRNKVEPKEITCDGNKVMQVLDYELLGDVNEDGLVNSDDLVCLNDYLLGRDVMHISNENTDIVQDEQLDTFDLCMLKRQMLNDETDTPEISVYFNQEKAGYWRMTNGIDDRTVTFYLEGEAGSTLNMGWGYYDPNYNNADGSSGKWIQNSLGEYTLDENGKVSITVEIPADTRRTGLEIYKYFNSSGNLEKSDVTLLKVIAK